MLRDRPILLSLFDLPPSIPSSLAIELMLKKSSSPAKGNISILILRRRQWQPRFRLPTGAFQVSSLDVTHSTIRHVYIYIFEDSRLEPIFSPSARRHYFENRSARAQARGATATSFSPDRTPQQLDFNFQGTLHWEKGALAIQTDRQRVCGLRQSGGLMATENAANSNGTTIKA